MVSPIIEKARARARVQIEKMYESTCSVWQFSRVYDKATHSTKMKKVALFENIPCHVSYGISGAAKQTETIAVIGQNITLYLPPEYAVPAGSEITIETQGRITKYESSGEPAVYQSHQEISLTLDDKEA